MTMDSILFYTVYTTEREKLSLKEFHHLEINTKIFPCTR